MMDSDRQRHLLGGAAPIPGSAIPKWKGSYRADWMWVRTACGTYIREGDPKGFQQAEDVSCGSCLRTRAVRGR